MTIENKKTLMAVGLIVLAALSRLIDHPANFTPIMAIAIFAGTYFKNKRYALVFPIFAMILSDIIIGFHLVSTFVYLSFIGGIFIGNFLASRKNVKNIIFATLSGSIFFFFVTNFGSWLTDPMYQPLSLESLIRSYYLGIPFFRNTLLGDGLYITVLFGSYNLASKYIPAFSVK